MDIRGRLKITESKWRTAVVLFVVLTFQHRILWELPLFNIGLPGNMPVYIMRTISALSSVLLIWIFVPDAMDRLKLKINRTSLPQIAGVVAIYFGVGFFQTHGYGLSIAAVIEGGIFSWFIGLDEELFGRGLIYGLLENRGREKALVGSAVIFGLQHFTNYLSGEDSFDYVLGHMVSAAGFGYLMAAAMIVSGSVWLPIFMHGLADYQWVLMDPTDAIAVTSGDTNWLFIAIGTSLMVLLARFMISGQKWFAGINSEALRGRFGSVLRYFGLVE
jgi:membrane protease YdiL (CAAX protease family)